MRRKPDELRADELSQIDAGVRAVRHLPEPACRKVEHPDVGRGRRARQRHREEAAVCRKLESAGDLRGELRTGERLARLQVEELDFAPAGHVPEERRLPARVVDLEIRELGVGPLGQDLDWPRRAVPAEPRAREGDAVAVLVGGQIHGPAIPRKRSAEAARPLVRREQRLLRGREIHEIEIVVAAADEAREERALAVARQVREASDPPVLHRETHLFRRDVVEIGVDRGAVPAVGSEREGAPVLRPDAQIVGLLAAVGQPPDAGAVGAREIDLLVHAAARREREREPRPLGRPRHASDRILERRDLLGPSAGGRDGEDLRNAGHVRDEGEALSVRGEARPRAEPDTDHRGDGAFQVVGKNQRRGKKESRPEELLHAFSSVAVSAADGSFRS